MYGPSVGWGVVRRVGRVYSCSTRLGWLGCKCVPFINCSKDQYRAVANEGAASTKMAKPMAKGLPSIKTGSKDFQTWVTPILAVVNRTWSQGLFPLFWSGVQVKMISFVNELTFEGMSGFREPSKSFERQKVFSLVSSLQWIDLSSRCAF